MRFPENIRRSQRRGSIRVAEPRLAAFSLIRTD
jgi:hypothetical protein